MILFAILLTFHYITAQFYDFLRIYQSDIPNSYKKSRQENLSGNSEQKTTIWKLLALYRCVLVESNQGEHFAGFFAGLCVYEEVLHEDFWGGGVRGAVLVVEVFFDVVLFADCFERLGDLDCLLEQLLAFKENLH